MTLAPTLRTVAKALGPAGRRRLVLLVGLTVLSALAEFATITAMLQLLRSWLGDGADSAGSRVFLLFALAILAAGSIRLLLFAATQRLGLATGHHLLVAVQRRVLARPWTVHVAARGSGPLAAVDLVEQWLFGVLLPVLQAGSAIVIGLGLLAALLWVNAEVAIVAALLLGALFLVVTTISRRSLCAASDALGEMYELRFAAIQDNVGGLRELILAGSREAAAERFRQIDRALADARTRMMIVGGVPRILVETLGIIALALVAAWLAQRPGGLAPMLPTLAALALGAQRLLPLAQSVSQAATNLAGMSGVQQRMVALLDGPDLDERAPAAPLPFTGEIALHDVAYAYPGRDEPVLQGIDLAIRRGERIALIGRNGSGKSTLADLVMGLLEPASGSILVDGEPLAPALVRGWQRNIAHVAQAPFLTDASIARNIAFSDEAPDHALVVQAATKVGLHDFIMALPRGYETRVGERGQLLSGGQRQRLALARAFYRQAPLLVLDEATSALDPASEQNVLSALDELQAAGTTIILIAHRETMLRGCDRVYRLTDGRIERT